MGTAKLYQTEWNNISLIKVSEKIKKNMDEIADIDFYQTFYTMLRENDWKLSDHFLEEKKALGKAVFNKLNPSKKDHIISLGAGLGICEVSAIRGGIT